MENCFPFPAKFKSALFFCFQIVMECFFYFLRKCSHDLIFMSGVFCLLLQVRKQRGLEREREKKYCTSGIISPPLTSSLALFDSKKSALFYCQVPFTGGHKVFIRDTFNSDTDIIFVYALRLQQFCLENVK